MNKLILALLLNLLLFSPFSAESQAVNQVYIHPKASLVAHKNASLNIFSDIVNANILKSYRTSVITFYGKNWQNSVGSIMPDESSSGLDSIGGNFIFSGIYLGAQNIITLHTQPNNGFPNITINNLQNVTAGTNNLHINNNLAFVNGNLILNNVNVNVGTSGKGSITGYSENGFVVTGTGMTGGSLVRSVTGKQGALIFPIGTSPGSYTPASIDYKGIPQNLRVRVADNVYNKLAFPEYVYKTWAIAIDFPDPDASIDLILQHNSIEEGTEYFRNRDLAYISRYDKTVTGLWDLQLPSASTTPGTLTTRAPIFNAYMNNRTITKPAAIEYFTKSVIQKAIDENTPSNIPEAISPNGDGLNDIYTIVKRLPTDRIRFEVYSRNHVLVFQDTDYQNTFNGTGNIGGFMGNTLPDGIYYYLISANNAKAIPGYLIINR